MPKAGTLLLAALIFSFLLSSLTAQNGPRARDLGVPFDGTPGPFNAITDVKGVEVGHTTLISGERSAESWSRPGAHRRDRNSSPRAQNSRTPFLPAGSL